MPGWILDHSLLPGTAPSRLKAYSMRLLEPMLLAAAGGSGRVAGANGQQQRQRIPGNDAESSPGSRQPNSTKL